MAAYYVIFHADSGNLFGISTFMPTSIPDGFTIEGRDDKYIPDNFKWSNTDKAFIDQTPKQRNISKLEFLERFTIAERIAIRTSADPVVADILHLMNLSEFIDLDNPILSDSLNYLVSINIISADRKTLILG